MSVASKNPFALLGDDDSSSAPAPAPAAAPAAAPAPTSRGNTRGRGGPASRGGGYYRRGGGTKSAPREGGDAAEEPAAGDEGRRKFGDSRGGRGGREGRGRGRGRGGRGGAGNRLDRHSATGITDSEKKIHQGWGGDEPGTELNAEVGGAADAAKESGDDWGVSPDSVPPPVEGAAPTAEGAEGADGGAPDRRREEEEEDNTLTLEQYRQQQVKSDIVPSKLEGRKVEDTEIKGDVLKKGTEEEESYFAGKAKAAPKARTEKKEKVFIEIDARFDRPQRGGRGRGGFERGRGRGGEGRGRGEGPRRGRGDRQNGAQSGPQINDESAFPALG